MTAHGIARARGDRDGEGGRAARAERTCRPRARTTVAAAAHATVAAVITVRLVDRADVPVVVEHVTAVLAEFGLAFGVGSETDEAVRALPSSYVDHGGAFWVAHDHDGDRSALLGTCGVFPVAPRTYELRKMYLAAAARGRGVGTRLLEEAVAWAKARGGERMVLDTTEAMTAAIAFYERHGFVRDDGQIRGSRCTRGYVRRL